MFSVLAPQPTTSANVLTNLADVLYIDGVLKHNSSLDGSWVTRQTLLPDDVQVVAIQGVNRAGTAGIIASDSAGRLWTNFTWRCNNVLIDGWTEVGFDDSGWSFAVAKVLNGGATYGQMSSFSSFAFWIWTNFDSSGNPTDQTVYCRKPLGTLPEQ